MTDATHDLDDFEAPGSTTGLDYEELNGKLLVFLPTDIVPEMETEYGTSTRIPRCSLLDVTGGVWYDDVLVFPKVLKGQLTSKVGRKVIGRLSQGQASGKQSPPWVLLTATDQDIAEARAYVNKYGYTTRPGAADTASAQVPF